MLKRMIVVLTLCTPLMGCGVTSLEGALQIVDAASKIYNSIKAGVETTRIAVSQECIAVSNLLSVANQITESSKASCKVKQAVNKYATRVAGYCNDLSTINSSSLKTVLSTVQSAKADAQAVIAAGCP